MGCAYGWCEVEETYVAVRDDLPRTVTVHRALLTSAPTDCGRVLSMSVIASDLRPDPHVLIEDTSGDGPPEFLLAMSHEAARRMALGALDGFEAIVRNAMTRTQHERAHHRRVAADPNPLVPPPHRYLRVGCVVGGDGPRRAPPKAGEQ